MDASFGYIGTPCITCARESGDVGVGGMASEIGDEGPELDADWTWRFGYMGSPYMIFRHWEVDVTATPLRKLDPDVSFAPSEKDDVSCSSWFFVNIHS